MFDPTKMNSWLLFSLGFVLPFVQRQPVAAKEPRQVGLSVRSDGVLIKDRKPFRGVGVNYFDAFYRTLLDPKNTSYEGGFRDLAALKIPFVRFLCSGFWPVECKLYRESNNLYFERLDAFVKCAEKYHIGLIPSLFWNLNTVPDLVGEPCDQWGNSESKTHEFMRAYVKEVVTRYRTSPAIWGWEFGNEYNLAADLPNASEWRPPVWPTLGTATSRSTRDELTHADFRTALACFGREVRKYDKHRLIVSGNSLPRPSAWHQRKEKSWTKDSPEQFEEMLLDDNPNPLDAICIHAYGENDYVKMSAEIAQKARKPLFVGEFGVEGPPTPETEKKFGDMLSVIDNEGVALAALWVYDHGDDGFSVTATNRRSYQLKAIAEVNKRYRHKLQLWGKEENHHDEIKNRCLGAYPVSPGSQSGCSGRDDRETRGWSRWNRGSQAGPLQWDHSKSGTGGHSR